MPTVYQRFNPAMQEIAKARNKLDFEQCKLLFEVEKRTKNCLSELAVNLSSYDDEDGNAINGRLQKGLNELCMTLDDILSESLVNVSAEFQTGYIGSMIELSNIDVTVNIDREESAFDDILSAVNKNTKGMPRGQMKETFKKFLTQKFVTGSAEAGTELMKGGARKSVEQVAKSGVKNTTKNMGKAAGKNIGKNFIKISGKTIGVCVDFAFAVYDITMALRVQKQYERQMIAKAQAVENMVSRLRSDVHSEIMRQMSKSVQDYFSVLLHELDKAENNLELAHSDSLAILDNLRNMYDQLAQLKAV